MPKRFVTYTREELLSLVNDAFAFAAGRDESRAEDFAIVGPEVRELVARAYAGKRYEENGISFDIQDVKSSDPRASLVKTGELLERIKGSKS